VGRPGLAGFAAAGAAVVPSVRWRVQMNLWR